MSLKIVLLGNDMFAYKATTKLVELLAKTNPKTQYTAIIPQLSTTVAQDSPIKAYSTFIKESSNMSIKGLKENWKLINNHLTQFQPNYGILFNAPYFDNSILKHFNKKFILAQPSLLPKYPGFDPIPHALYNNEKSTGLSICELKDEGGIHSQGLMYQEEITINDNETYTSLATRIGESAGTQLNKIIEEIENGFEHQLDDVEGDVQTKGPISRLLCVTTMTAEEVVRLHKALIGDNYQPATFIYINNGLVLVSLVNPKLYNGQIIDKILAEPPGTLYWDFDIDESQLFIRCKEGVVGCKGLRLMQARKQARGSSPRYFIKQYIKADEGKKVIKTGKVVAFNGADKVEDLKAYKNFIDKKFHYILSI